MKPDELKSGLEEDTEENGLHTDTECPECGCDPCECEEEDEDYDGDEDSDEDEDSDDE